MPTVKKALLFIVLTIVIIAVGIYILEYQSKTLPPIIPVTTYSPKPKNSFLPTPGISTRVTPSVSLMPPKTPYDLSTLKVNIHPPLHAILFGPQSQRLGFDTETQAVLREFPKTWYAIEMQTIPPGSQEIDIDQPPAGEYRLKILGLGGDYESRPAISIVPLTGPQDYRLDFYFHYRGAEPFVPPSMYGMIRPNEVHEYRIIYSPEPGAKIEVRRVPEDSDYSLLLASLVFDTATATAAPLEFSIVDPLGRKTSWNYRDGIIDQEIPKSAASGYDIVVADDLLSDPVIYNRSRVETLAVEIPAKGTYRVYLSAPVTSEKALQDYRLSIDASDYRGRPLSDKSVGAGGQVEAGVAHIYEFFYSPEPGAKIEVKRIQ